jgi:hypothetical protein
MVLNMMPWINNGRTLSLLLPAGFLLPCSCCCSDALLLPLAGSSAACASYHLDQY